MASKEEKLLGMFLISKTLGPDLHLQSNIAQPPRKKSITLESETSCNFHYFHMYLKSGFYLCIVPFQPIFDEKSRHYRLQTNGFQRILCFISWSFALMCRLTYIRATWQTTGKHPTIFYFNLVHSHAHAILNLLFYRTFMKFKEFEEMIETIGHCSLLRHPANYRQRWIMMITTHFSWIIIGMLCTVFGMGTTNWSLRKMYLTYVSAAKYTFFANKNITETGLLPEISNVSTTESMLGILQMCLVGAEEVQMFLMTSVLGICPITMWVASTNFERYIQSLESLMKDGYKISAPDLIDQFYELKTLSDSINRVWHLFCFWYILDITVWLATDLDTALRTNDYFLKFHMCYFLIYAGTVMTLSAESFRKMQSFRLWILNRDIWQTFWTHREEMKVLLHEVQIATVGIGSSGFYQVDYPFIGEVSVMVITFFIISIQYAQHQSL